MIDFFSRQHFARVKNIISENSFIIMSRHLGKPGFWRSKQYFPRSAFSKCLYVYIAIKLYRKREHVVFVNAHMFKKSQGWSVGFLIRVCSLCHSITRVSPDDITVMYQKVHVGDYFIF